MSFVRKICGPDETIIGVAHVHWIYALRGLLWLLAMVAVGLFADHFVGDLLGDRPWLILISFFVGVLMFLPYAIIMIATEIGLTSKRVIFKQGLIFTEVLELDIEEIKAVSVDNGYFGRFLNYGYLVLDARFVDNSRLPAINKPYRYVKALNEARSRLQANEMNVSVDVNGMEAKVDGGVDDASEPHESPVKTGSGEADAPHSLQDDRYKALEGEGFTSDFISTEDSGDGGEKPKKEAVDEGKTQDPVDDIVVFDDERAMKEKLHDEVLDEFQESSDSDHDDKKG